MHKEEIIEIMKGKEVIYNALSDYFIHTIDNNNLNTLYDIINLILLNNLENHSVVNNLYNVLKTYKNQTLEEQAKMIDNINLSYTRLFCLGQCVAVSESVYLSQYHLTKQQPEEEVEKIYKRYNFKIINQSNEPLDHISYELKFMSYISKGIYTYLENNNIEKATELMVLQKRFLQEHILLWLSMFINDILIYEETMEFYKPLCLYLEYFVKNDEVFLSNIDNPI